MSNYIQAEILANLETAQKRVLPAVLADVPDNGNLISAYILRNKLDPTPDGTHQRTQG